MIFNTAIYSGGGAEINVITAASLPATVTDGQIVVITDTTPNNIYVDTDEPANPVEGDVWVVVGTSETGIQFDSTFRNGFNAVKQYNNSAWQFMAGYIGVNGEWVQFAVELPAIGTPMNEFTWANLDYLSRAGLADTYFEIGDTKAVVINGVTYYCEVIDFKHDTLADVGDKAGITFGLKTCLNTTYAMNSTATSVGGWTGSVLRNTLQSTIWGQLPEDLRSVIKTVEKTTSAGNKSTTLVKSTDNLFLYSDVEVFGNTQYGVPGEGTQYARFTDNAARIKTVGGTAAFWWLRSPFKTANGYFCFVDITGVQASNYAATTAANTQKGVSFGFCI